MAGTEAENKAALEGAVNELEEAARYLAGTKDNTQSAMEIVADIYGDSSNGDAVETLGLVTTLNNLVGDAIVDALAAADKVRDMAASIRA